MAGSIGELLVRVGVEGIPAFRNAFKDAIEALETTGTRAVQAGNAINRAFSNLGVADASAKVATEAKKLQGSFELLERSFKDGKISAADFAKAQDGLRLSLEKLGNTAEPLASKITRIGDAFKSTGVTTSQFQISNQVDKLKASLNELEREYKEGTISAADFAKAQKAVSVEIDKLNKSDFTSGIDRLQKQMGNVATTAKSFGSTMTFSVTAPIVAFAGASIKAAADMESLRIGLAAVTKDTGPLEAQLRRLQEVAKLPGLGFKEAVQGSINLQAAGFSAGTAERALKAFGNALATVGKGRAELDGVVLALSQIASKGKISAEEINQLAERLPQIRVAIKDAFGAGFTDAKAFEAAGITAEVFVEKIIAQFEKLPKAAGGFKNDLENIRDSAEQTLAAFGKVLLPFASSALKAIQPIIDGLQSFALEFARLPEPIQTATVGLVAFAAAAGPVLFAFGGMADGASALIGLLAKIAAPASVAGVKGLAGSLAGLGSALAALGPAAAVATVAVGVGFGLYKLKPQAEELIVLLRAVAKEYKDYIDALATGADAAKQPFIIFGQQIAELGKFAAELSPAFVTGREAINAFKEDAASTSPVLGNVAKAFEDMKARFVWTDIVTGYGAATAAAREFLISTIDVVRRVSGVYPEMAEAAERNLARVQRANAEAMRIPIANVTATLTGVQSVQSGVAANLQELKTAQETLKALKAMKASKEELAEATTRVTNAQRKLHPELTATGNAAGSASKGADELGAALKRLGTVEEKSAIAKLKDDIALVDKAFAAKTISASQYQKAYQGYFEQIIAINKKEADAFAKLGKDAEKAASDVSLSFAKAAEKLKEDYKNDLKPIEITLKLKDQIGPELFRKYEQTVKSAKDLATAFRVAGVQQASLVDQADDLLKAYRLIEASVGKIGGASQGQADQARARFLEAEIRAQRELNGEVQRYQVELTKLLAAINDIKSADDAYRNAGLQTLTELQVEAERAAKAYAIIGQTGQDSAVRILTAQQRALEAQREVAIATGQAWDGIDDQLQRVADRLKRATDLKGVSDLQAAFRNFANDAGAAISKSFGDAFDALVKGDFKGIGKAFSDMWKGVAAAAVKDFTEPLKDALATFFGRTVRDLLKGSLSGIKEDMRDLANVIKGIFGAGASAASTAAKAGTTAANAAGTASQVGDLGGAATSAGSGAGQAAGSAGGLLGAIGIASQIASAVSSIIGNFQFFAMNKSLDIIVKHTLQTANDLANLRTDEWTREGHLFKKLDDLAQFTWTKLDDVVNAVRGIALAGVTAGEGIQITGIEPLLSAISSGAASIVAAIQKIGAVAGESATRTETIVLRNAEEMTQYVGKLVQDQAAAFSALPLGIQQAIDAGKLAELVEGQDDETKAAIANYVRLSEELKQVREAVNSLKPVAAATAKATESAAVDLSNIRTTITPTNGGFDTGFLGNRINELSDRMAGYWEKLFEVLAAGQAQDVSSSITNTGAVTTTTTSGAAIVADAVSQSSEAVVKATENVGAMLGEDIATLRFQEQFRAEELAAKQRLLKPLGGGVTVGLDMNTIRFQEQFDAEEEAKRQARLNPRNAGAFLVPYVKPDYSDAYINTVPAINQSVFSSAAFAAPSVANWQPAQSPATSATPYPMPPQIPIQVTLDGAVIAERMAVYYEQLGYR